MRCIDATSTNIRHTASSGAPRAHPMAALMGETWVTTATSVVAASSHSSPQASAASGSPACVSALSERYRISSFVFGHRSLMRSFVYQAILRPKPQQVLHHVHKLATIFLKFILNRIPLTLFFLFAHLLQALLVSLVQEGFLSSVQQATGSASSSHGPSLSQEG